MHKNIEKVKIIRTLNILNKTYFICCWNWNSYLKQTLNIGNVKWRTSVFTFSSTFTNISNDWRTGTSLARLWSTNFGLLSQRIWKSLLVPLPHPNDKISFLKASKDFGNRKIKLKKVSSNISLFKIVYIWHIDTLLTI